MAAKGRIGIAYAEWMKINDLLSKIPEGQTLVDLIDKLFEDEMRIGVINWDTFFDNNLKSLLMLRFSREDKAVKKLFEPSIGGPLVSLTSKARLAYALGIIDKTALNDFENIHNIRNKFAHNTKMNFANTEVLKLVKKLSTAKEGTAKNSYDCFAIAIYKCLKYFLKLTGENRPVSTPT